MYDAEVDGEVTSFGTSGFLYQSNKLMYDRATNTLWHSLTGEPVIGPLAESDINLTSIPVDVATWSDWVAEHPETTVLAIETGFDRRYLPPGDPGSAYFEYRNSPDRLFPTFTKDSRLSDKEPVLALEFDGGTKAYPISTLTQERVVNDVVGGQEVVIIAGPGRVATRAYERDGLSFREEGTAGLLIDDEGESWNVTEEALVSEDRSRFLSRLPSRELFWLGWSALFPLTDLYVGAEDAE